MDRTQYADIKTLTDVPSFHDAELIAVEHHPDDRELVLSFRRVGGEVESLLFTGVISQRMVDFAEQNVASRLLISPRYRFSTGETRTWMQWINSRDDAEAAAIDDVQAEQYARDFLAGRQALFVLEPSCGAEVAVLSEVIWLRKPPGRAVRYSDVDSLDRFHDWNIDILTTGEDNRLILGLQFNDRRATVTFVGTSRCSVKNFGPKNIVRGMEIFQAGQTGYDVALTELARLNRLSEKLGQHVAFVTTTAGAELLVEFEAIEIEST